MRLAEDDETFTSIVETHNHRPYCVTWIDKAASFQRPDLLRLPRPGIDISRIPLDPAIERIWKTSRALQHRIEEYNDDSDVDSMAVEEEEDHKEEDDHKEDGEGEDGDDAGDGPKADEDIYAFGGFGSVRVMADPSKGGAGNGNAHESQFPVIKLAHPDEHSRASVEREFRILLEMHREAPGLPIVQIDQNPIVDSRGVIWGFRMKRLYKRDSQYASDEELEAEQERIRAAVQKLHQAGFVHGDLHSGNAMKNESGEIVLVDFGVSGRLGERIVAIFGWDTDRVYKVEHDLNLLHHVH